jgi:hypothetical protein
MAVKLRTIRISECIGMAESRICRRRRNLIKETCSAVWATNGHCSIQTRSSQEAKNAKILSLYSIHHSLAQTDYIGLRTKCRPGSPQHPFTQP